MTKVPPRGHGPRLEALATQVGVREQVTQILREAMVVGDLAPGEVYSAPPLARTLGVSPTPVREAMMELAKEGHVEILRQKGYRVVEIADTALREILEVRALLEVPTVGRVAAVASPDHVGALRPLADQLTESAAAGEFRAFIAADTEFHVRLLALAGNARLVQEVRRLRGFSRLPGLRALHERGLLVTTALEHHELLDLVEHGDVEGAQSLMRTHLGHVRGVWAGRKESGHN